MKGTVELVLLKLGMREKHDSGVWQKSAVTHELALWG